MQVSKLTTQRVISRNTNPFSPAQLNRSAQAYKNKNLYEDLVKRSGPASINNDVQKAIADLKARINQKQFAKKDFGRIEYVKLSDLVINIDNQRDVDWDHVAHIIKTFDPRAVQVVNTIKLVNGKYSVPEGQHTAVVLKILYDAGLLEKDFEVQCKVVDENATVPGSELKGEAFGNLLFRIINYKGRKAVEPYYMHRSRVSGVRNYGSTLLEDVQAERIQQCVDNNNMYCAPAIEARGHGAKPGMITYINGLNKIAGLESNTFDESINDLEFALQLHNQYFSNEKGVDGGFILAFGRYAALARVNDFDINKDWKDALMKFFKQTYASPSKFHKTCKARLDHFNKQNSLPGGWSDNCLLSILILDFYNWCSDNSLDYPALPDKNINKYNGI